MFEIQMSPLTCREGIASGQGIRLVLETWQSRLPRGLQVRKLLATPFQAALVPLVKLSTHSDTVVYAISTPH